MPEYSLESGRAEPLTLEHRPDVTNGHAAPEPPPPPGSEADYGTAKAKRDTNAKALMALVVGIGYCGRD